MSSKDLSDALRKLMESQPTQGQPEPMPVRGGVSSSKSAAPLGGGGKSASGGIASPLVELSSSTREYYSTGWKTTDGLFSFPALKKVVMTDANDNTVVFEFAAP